MAVKSISGLSSTFVVSALRGSGDRDDKACLLNDSDDGFDDCDDSDNGNDIFGDCNERTTCCEEAVSSDDRTTCCDDSPDGNNRIGKGAGQTAMVAGFPSGNIACQAITDNDEPNTDIGGSAL